MSDDGFVTLMHHFTEKELGIILMDPKEGEVATKTTLELIKIQSTMPSRKKQSRSRTEQNCFLEKAAAAILPLQKQPSSC